MYVSFLECDLKAVVAIFQISVCLRAVQPVTEQINILFISCLLLEGKK